MNDLNSNHGYTLKIPPMSTHPLTVLSSLRAALENLTEKHVLQWLELAMETLGKEKICESVFRQLYREGENCVSDLDHLTNKAWELVNACPTKKISTQEVQQANADTFRELPDDIKASIATFLSLKDKLAVLSRVDRSCLRLAFDRRSFHTVSLADQDVCRSELPKCAFNMCYLLSSVETFSCRTNSSEMNMFLPKSGVIPSFSGPKNVSTHRDGTCFSFFFGVCFIISLFCFVFLATKQVGNVAKNW